MTEVPAFRKNADDEELLTRINTALAGAEEATYRELPERYPTVHVIGVPRSGTTLATQLVAANLDVGYINQLVAAFWRAPTLGIRLSRKLMPDMRPASYRSEFGRTKGIAEPHEFGYFWRELLGYDDLADSGPGLSEAIDWQRVRRVLVNMTWAFERATLFKSFLFSMHIPDALHWLPTTCFLRIRRDPVDNALSLLKMREQFLGSASLWASVKPREYGWLKDQSIPVQVAGQVTFLEKMIDRGVDAVNGRNVLDVSYEELCGNPAGVIDRVRELLRKNGADVRRLATEVPVFRCSRPSDDAPETMVAAIKDAFGSLREMAGSGTNR